MKMKEEFVPLQDLAIIGDRQSCALLDKEGRIVWYCPSRFDHPSLFAHLLDPQMGGCWEIVSGEYTFHNRTYIKDSAILQTRLNGPGGKLELEDFMPLNGPFNGICRLLGPAPEALQIKLSPRPNYARQFPEITFSEEKHAVINYSWHVYASHPLRLQDQDIYCQVPAGEKAWFVLSSKNFRCSLEWVKKARKDTLSAWTKLASHVTYKGPYEQAVRQSLRILRLLTYNQNGGIIAAATTALPEVISGERNYDYRYVWLRDAAMIVSALTRAGSDGEEERKFLSFICGAMHRLEAPDVPFFTLDMQPAPRLEVLPLGGYKKSTPVQIGNIAKSQLQLDAISNVLIAAKVIYNQFNTREHWETISRLANYLVENWEKPDHGMWEETEKRQYTASKVITACSLEYIADHAKDPQQKEKWKATAEKIRKFIHGNCLTSKGAYAAFAGSEAVDVSAILFPIWGFTEANAPEVLQTVEALEKEYCHNNLYYRHLTQAGGKKEGSFLAGTLWMAQYWVMRKDLKKVEDLLGAALSFKNDVGIMPEEGDSESGQWLGNLPQTFVHASLIGAIIDYKEALESRNTAS